MLFMLFSMINMYLFVLVTITSCFEELLLSKTGINATLVESVETCVESTFANSLDETKESLTSCLVAT